MRSRGEFIFAVGGPRYSECFPTPGLLCVLCVLCVGGFILVALMPVGHVHVIGGQVDRNRVYAFYAFYAWWGQTVRSPITPEQFRTKPGGGSKTTQHGDSELLCVLCVVDLD
jgi:hypothetical protein